MRITAVAERSSGWFSLGAEPTDFDGCPPVPALRLQWPVVVTGADRLAVGAALVYSAWTSGVLHLPQQFSALTAQRISEWYAAQGVWVQPGEVRRGGLPIPRGNRVVRLTTVSGKSGPVLERGTRNLSFVGSASGTSFRAAGLEIASNLVMLRQEGAAGEHANFAALGAAVLVAEGVGISRIEVPWLGSLGQELSAATVRLLESVSLGLVDASRNS